VFSQFWRMEVTFTGCLTGTSVLFIVVVIGANWKLISRVAYVTALDFRCADIMISEKKNYTGCGGWRSCSDVG
jgi:hypothetical protein